MQLTRLLESILTCRLFAAHNAEMHRGTYSFLGNGRVLKAHFQVVALQAVSNVQAWEHVRHQGMGTGAREK